MDTHVDTTQRMLAGDDIAERMPDGHLDLPRMREGWLDGAFFSIWVSPDRHPGEEAWAHARALIGAVRALAEEHPDEAALCTSAEEVRRAHADGKTALLVGVEGGHALGTPEDEETVLARLRELHALGARYLTITWSNDNALGHASTGDHPERGLTELGRRVVREMNRLGMIVDVSHVSDRTFWDILEVTERPVLASHSSSRALAEHPRNMTDRMIRAVAEQGGAVCINYYTQYIDTEYRRRRRAVQRAHRGRFRALREEHEHSWQRWRDANALARELDPELDPPTLRTLGAHFEHVVEVGGPRAACLGSDFDGVGELPDGLADVSDLGALREELERRDLPVAAIFGRNVLRVLEAQQGPRSDASR
ncbi:MAG TPA: dipeptidase [Sandaracinaceae bacterium LLY-WYZ-13_1]|nr:dipeptidase [Sandaracinaceae bacterium LLY-WYZ-13_1]